MYSELSNIKLEILRFLIMKLRMSFLTIVASVLTRTLCSVPVGWAGRVE